MRVTDPDGVEWEVTRRWLDVPRWWRWRMRDYVDVGSGMPAETDFAAFVLVVVLILVFVLVGFPLLLLLLALLVAVLGLAARIVFGRPWLVEAKSERGELQWRVRGLRSSRRALHEIARAFELGDRSFSPAGAERLLPDSPLVSDRQSNVRVLP